MAEILVGEDGPEFFIPYPVSDDILPAKRGFWRRVWDGVTRRKTPAPKARADIGQAVVDAVNAYNKKHGKGRL